MSKFAELIFFAILFLWYRVMWRKYARAYPVAIIQSTQTYTNVLVHRWIGDSFICIDLQQLEAINCGQNIAHCQNTETDKIDENLIMNNFYEMI